MRRPSRQRPSLAQRVAEERECARRVAEFGDDEFGKSRFDAEAAPARGLFDHAFQILVPERAEQDLARLQPAGEIGEAAEFAVEVGPHRSPRSRPGARRCAR